MKKTAPILAVLAALVLPPLLGAAAPALAQASRSTDRTVIPVNFVEAGCTGERIAFSGTIVVVRTQGTDAAGGSHYQALTHFANVTGVGLTSGIKYQAVGALSILTTNSGQSSEGNGPTHNSGTHRGTYLLVSQGAGPNLLFHVTSHHTVNANGELTAVVHHQHIECVG